MKREGQVSDIHFQYEISDDELGQVGMDNWHRLVRRNKNVLTTSRGHHLN